MKQFIYPLFLLTLFIVENLFCTACGKGSDGTDDYAIILPDSKTDEKTAPIIKGICLFAGQAETFTDADWQALANSPVTDFIIIPKEASYYGTSETGYKAKLAPFMINVINQLVSRKSSSKIWIGTPGISSLNYTSLISSFDPIHKYLSYVRDQVGASVWSNNIGGVYMNMEAIYGSVNYSNIYENSCIKLMNDISYSVHNALKTKFLWIPYYGYGTDPAEIIKRIGYVAKTNIFDYVVIQPHYYFDETVPENLTGVQHCVRKQNVCYRDGVAVSNKTSQTIIGVEMEFSWKIVSPNNYADCVKRYNEYVTAFSEFKNTKPIIFYWDGNMQNALSSRINSFFQ